MNACRTLRDALPLSAAGLAAPEPVAALSASQSAGRVCEICGVPLAATARPNARTCSSKCRSVKSRRSRLAALVARLRASEVALRDAADALGQYRELIEQDIGKAIP